MELILWRHADAEDGEPDIERNLSAKGRRQAKRMARWLREHLPPDARILCSPANRTRQTADALHRPYELCDPIAPDCNTRDFIKASGWPRGDGTVVLVGHNPALSDAASVVLAGKAFPMSLRKGSVLWLTNRTREGEPDVVIKAALVPSMLKKG